MSAPQIGMVASQRRALARWGFTRKETDVWEKPHMRFEFASEPQGLPHSGRLDVTDADSAYAFDCSSVQELKRAAGLLDHEAGTYAWLKDSIRSGDIVYDIGANIGLYTIVSGRRVGPDGHVYAFEPHAANVPRLMRNMEINDLVSVATCISVPLADAPGYDVFVYDSLEAGNGTSGLKSARRNETGEGGEVKAVTSIDELLRCGVIRPPSLVKLDLKGVPSVLRGMEGLLSSDERPRGLQVEVSDRDESEITEAMAAHGYAIVDSHLSSLGERRAAAQEAHVRNLVFSI